MDLSIPHGASVPAIFAGGWALQQLWLFIVAPWPVAFWPRGFYLGIRETAPMISTPQAEQALPSHQAERQAVR